MRLPLSLLQTTRIQSENFGASYFLVPSNVICLDVGELQDSCRVTPGGAFFSEEGAHPLNFQYSYSYYTDYVYYNSWILAGGVDFDNEEALKLLTDLRNVLQENEDVWYNTASSYLHQQIEADYYRELCTENTLEISSELKDFALSLTDGLSNDYEKAAAIESFSRPADLLTICSIMPRMIPRNISCLPEKPAPARTLLPLMCCLPEPPD